MSAPRTRDELLTLLRSSGLVTSSQLDAALQGFEATELNAILTRLVRAGLITDFQGKELYAGRNRGFFIGKYKVLRPLAAGGMGMVLHCEHVHMQHHVALKLLPREQKDDHQSVARFYREARAVAAVRHPNIVKAYDVGQEGPWHYLVMEYVDGINFYRLVKRRGPLSEVQTAHYLAQIARGLQEIMAGGLVHRDLKPGNLLLDREGTVRILDLGLARFTDQRADDLTRELSHRSVLGTADFVSPEQALHSSKVDIRSDLYSLGMTAYFLLTGQLPFPGGTLTAKLMAHQEKSPTPIEQHRPGVSLAMRSIVNQLIQKKPGDRFQTPRELEEVLEPWTSQSVEKPDSAWFRDVQKPIIQGRLAVPRAGMVTTLATPPPVGKKLAAMETMAPVGSTVAPEPATDSVNMSFESDGDPLAALRDLSTYSLQPRSSRSSSLRLTRRTRRQLLLAGAVALPILGGLGLALWIYVSNKQPVPPPRPNRLAFPTRP